jgi:hypothetical protein
MRDIGVDPGLIPTLGTTTQRLGADIGQNSTTTAAENARMDTAADIRPLQAAYARLLELYRDQSLNIDPLQRLGLAFAIYNLMEACSL